MRQDFLAAIVFHSYKIFSLPLPGVTVITADYIDAASQILSSPEISREVSLTSFYWLFDLSC
jgi:hypothetical protein